jgi:ankyrin repeat protein
MEMNQWTLVARVMEFIVDDDMRHQVMQRAMESREGSVVWRCLSTMQHYRPSEEEREKLFQQAMDCGMWQLQKLLIEEKDNTGIRHRDTALLKAIEQRQWDVVDYCQLYDADIDMKDEHGETPLNREARWWNPGKEWKAVEELVVRGADPNLLDKDGRSVMTLAIHQHQWETFKLLIEYQANIHQPAHSWCGLQTPLRLLINKRQVELIHHTLMWCPDQAKGVNEVGETTLHAIALNKDTKLLYWQIARGVDPLRQTNAGESVLLYAVQNSYCPQRMVAQCIRLGLSTHQPALTRHPENILYFFTNIIWYNESRISSPLLIAVVRRMNVVAHMLYESGSCSHAELLHMYGQLLELLDPNTDSGRQLLKSIYQSVRRRGVSQEDIAFRQKRYKDLTENITTFLPYLKEMVSTPRSLVSSCRLVISHCLTIRRRRKRAVRQLTLPIRSATGELYKQKLPLPERIKNYLLFSDLTDPDYASELHDTSPCFLLRRVF